MEPEKIKYELGDYVEFTQGFNLKCNGRFNYRDSKLPVPAKNIKLTGIVCGFRIVIMEDYEFRSRGQSDWGDREPPEANGKKSQVLLVSYAMNRKHIYVRKQDIVLVSRPLPDCLKMFQTSKSWELVYPNDEIAEIDQGTKK